MRGPGTGPDQSFSSRSERLPGTKIMMAAMQEENLRNSIFAIDVSKSLRSVPMRNGTACAVKTEGPAGIVLVTSRKVVEHGGQLSCSRFCPNPPDYEDDYLLKDTLEPRYTQQFCFIPLQTTLKYSLKLVSTDKLRVHDIRDWLIQSDCLSYTFFGNSFKTLTWKFNEEQKTHELTRVDPKGDLVTSACRGSPVVSTQDEDRSVIGVVDCTSDGDLFLTFFNESSFEALGIGQPVQPALDVTDSPVIPPPVPAPPEREQFNEEGNNPSRESGLANDDPCNTSESAARRPPEENDTQQGREIPTKAHIAAVTRSLSHTSIQETARDEEKKCSLERTSQELPCIWHQEVQNLKGFQDLLTTVLKINLDPKRALGGDFRSLAGAFGKDMKYIWFLEAAPSPTEQLLKDCRPPLKLLKDMLLSKEVVRKDVAKEVTAWVKQNCECSNCSFSLR